MIHQPSFFLAAISDNAIPAAAPLVQANQTNPSLGHGMANQTMQASQSLPTSHTETLLNAVQHGSDTWSSYFSSLAILFFILGALWLIAWFIRKKGGLFSANGAALFIENRLALGGKKFLLIARVNNQRILLGVTEQNISLLTELENKEFTSKGNPNEPFSEVLAQRIEKNTVQEGS